MPLSGDHVHRMLQRADDGGEVFLCGLLRAGEVDDEAFTSRSGDSAGRAWRAA